MVYVELEQARLEVEIECVNACSMISSTLLGRDGHTEHARTPVAR